MERPWKEPSSATMRVRPVRRESLMAASVASVPELAKKTPEPAGAGAISRSRSASAIGRLGGEEVGDVDGRLRLLRHGLHEGRVAVAERVDGDAREQVEVALAVDVGDPAAVAGREHELGRAEDLDHGAGVALEQLAAGGHGAVVLLGWSGARGSDR